MRVALWTTRLSLGHVLDARRMTTTTSPAHAAAAFSARPPVDDSVAAPPAARPPLDGADGSPGDAGSAHGDAGASHGDAGAGLPDVLDAHTPLPARADLDRRVRQLIPCAVQRQLWLLLFDENDVQMPVMIPIGDLPLHADGPAVDGEGVLELLVMMAKEFTVASFVFVLEREGSRSLSDDDVAWLTYLLEVDAGRDFRVRAAYLCHDDGVSGYDEADLDELSRRRHQAVSASSFDM
jgi:hypothetical protein